MYCAGNINRRKNCEDICLQERNENFEAGQEDQHEERENSDRNQNSVASLKQRLAEKRENYEQ
jgi:hypothetical protein